VHAAATRWLTVVFPTPGAPETTMTGPCFVSSVVWSDIRPPVPPSLAREESCRHRPEPARSVRTFAAVASAGERLVNASFDREAEHRFVWIGFAGFMVMLSGAVTIVQGLWALDHKDSGATKNVAAQLSYANLETWGWIMLIWGVIAFFAGFAVFGRKEWGRWIGIVASAISIILAFFWVFAFPLAAFTIIFIDVLVIYALFTQVGGDAPIA
jgi:uncharacterized membrane protein (DUF2068 family)